MPMVSCLNIGHQRIRLPDSIQANMSSDSFNFNCFVHFLSTFWCFQESLLTYFLLSWVGLSKALHLAVIMFVCRHIFLLPFPSVNWIFQARPGRSYWVGLRQNPSPTPKQTFHCWIINIGPFTTTLTYASAIADDAGDDDDDRNYIQILMFILTTHTIAHYAHLPLCDHCAGSSKLSKLKKIVQSALAKDALSYT